MSSQVNSLDTMVSQEEESPWSVISSHLKRRQHRRGVMEQTAESTDWQSRPEIPAPNEIMATQSPILPYCDGSPDWPQYLEKQYLMYRHEGLQPLRAAVESIRDGPVRLNHFAFVFTQVRVQGYFFTKKGAGCRISFSTELFPNRINWKESKKFTPGNLVALTTVSDKFQTICRIGVIAARPLRGGLLPGLGEDENTPPRIEIYWANPQDAVIDPYEDMLMVEARSGFFESVRFAMTGLQIAAQSSSKFEKFLVYDSFSTQEGFEEDAQYVEELAPEMPTGNLTLDESQVQAFERMTSKELALVQGPPGTGKTFTSIVAIESIIRAWGKKKHPPPLIVAAQTNHALDQLLEECLAKDFRIARIGGRCRNEAVKERTLFNLRYLSKAPRKKGNQAKEKERKSLLRQFEELMEKCFPEGLLSAEALAAEGIINETQLQSLNSDEWETVDDVEDGCDDSNAGALLEKWMDRNIEKDTTYIHTSPQGQSYSMACMGAFDEAEQVDFMIHEGPDDIEEEEELLRGTFVPTKHHLTGASHLSKGKRQANASRLLKSTSDLYQILPEQRGAVYQLMREQLLNKIKEKIPRILEQYPAVCDDIMIEDWFRDVKVIEYEKVQVIGCTATGLSKYRGLLAGVKPRVLLIEEAAETREPNIASALFPSLDQIILVGDHQQLVPGVDVHELTMEPYQLNVSLFERLVKLHVPFSKLQVQQRMVSAIREVVEVFYPGLRDHSVVQDPTQRPPVPGMGSVDLWWFTHSWPQDRNDALSFCNIDEAKMIVGFAQYLAQNGTPPGQITILTYYTAQVELIKKLITLNSWFQNHCPDFAWVEAVRTVDGFQGEQNEVIILSLVRSRLPNGKPSVGFVSNENRAVVALSRAKRGLFIFGDESNLLQSPDSRLTWGKVWEVFEGKGRFGTALPVTCQKHTNITKVREPDDWAKLSGGGCSTPCDESCSRGHPCEVSCHPGPQSELPCQRPCHEILACGHGCATVCGQSCRCPHKCGEPKLKDALRPLHLSQPPKLTSVPAWTGIVKQAARAVPQKVAKETKHSTPNGPNHLTSEDLMTRYSQSGSEEGKCTESVSKPKQQGTGATGQSPSQGVSAGVHGPLTIRETFKPTVVSSIGRVVKARDAHQVVVTQVERQAEDEEDLIDLS